MKDQKIDILTKTLLSTSVTHLSDNFEESIMRQISFATENSVVRNRYISLSLLLAAAVSFACIFIFYYLPATGLVPILLSNYFSGLRIIESFQGLPDSNSLFLFSVISCSFLAGLYFFDMYLHDLFLYKPYKI